jgi:hypothetical protein
MTAKKSSKGVQVMLKYALLATLASGPVIAADTIPVYNTAQYCNAITAAVADNATKGFMMQGCVGEERRRQGQLTRLMNYISQDTIKRCDALARASAGGSYQIFAGCLVMQISDDVLEGRIEILRKSAAK